MPITAIPRDLDVRKLTAAQANALKKYLSESGDKSLAKYALLVGIPTLAFVGVAVGTGVLVWSYLKDIELPSWKDVQEAAGGVVADVVVDVGGATARAAGFEDNPANPEYISAGGRTIGPLTRCKRWELDANDWHQKVYDSGEDVNSVQASLAAKRIIKNMKKEGCDKPPAFTQSQWDD